MKNMLCSAGVLFSLLVMMFPAQAQTINTIAGAGTRGYSGDGGAATNAKLNYPTSVAVDGSGNVYISDQYNNCIRKVSASGIITTIAGTGTAGYSGDGGPAVNAQFYQPFGVAVDGSGNVYIADAYNGRIRKITAATGVITTIAGTGTSGYSGDGGLYQLHVSAGGASAVRSIVIER